MMDCDFPPAYNSSASLQDLALQPTATVVNVPPNGTYVPAAQATTTAAVQPPVAPHPAHTVLLVVACLCCVASFAFCCVAVASPYLYTVTSSRTDDDQDGTYTSTYHAYIGPFWYITCYDSSDDRDGQTSDYSECDNNAGSAFVTNTGKMAMVQALIVLSCVVTVLPGVLVIARAVRLLWKQRPVYSPRWDRVLIIALLLSSIVLLITVAAVGALDVASITQQLMYENPQSSSFGVAFALLVVALGFSVLVLGWITRRIGGAC